MKTMCISAVAVCLMTGMSSSAYAEDAPVPSQAPLSLAVRSSDVKKTPTSDDEWKHRVDIDLSMPLLGYEPATVLSAGQKDPFDATTAPSRIFRFGGTLAAEGEYAAFDLRPYTDVRAHGGGVQVAVGGLEVRLSTPFSKPFVVGFYHHSSHNFSDGAYGFGTNLNSFYTNVRLVKGSFGLFGDAAAYELRTEAHVFMTTDATPYVMTDTAKVLPGQSGDTAWRVIVRLDGRHPYGRMSPSLTMNGDGKWMMASGKIDVPVTFKVGHWLFGSFGEHLYAGPYGTFGWNLYETQTYGAFAWSAGLRMQLVVSDTTH